MFFVYHLQAKKNPMDYTGVDSYVKECMDEDDLAWIPNRTSLVMQNRGMHLALSGDGSDDEGGGSSGKGDKGGASDKVVEEIAENVKVMLKGLEGMEMRLAKLEMSDSNNSGSA